MKRKMTIDKAIELLKQNYNYALRQRWIHDPVAWALFKTWREADIR